MNVWRVSFLGQQHVHSDPHEWRMMLAIITILLLRLTCLFSPLVHSGSVDCLKPCCPCRACRFRILLAITVFFSFTHACCRFHWRQRYEGITTSLKTRCIGLSWLAAWLLLLYRQADYVLPWGGKQGACCSSKRTTTWLP